MAKTDETDETEDPKIVATVVFEFNLNEVNINDVGKLLDRAMRVVDSCGQSSVLIDLTKNKMPYR